MIKNVKSLLEAEHQTLTTFVTLSPIPGLRKWLLSKHGSAFIDKIEGDESKLMPLCKEYLKQAPSVDPVARFHLRNGAKLFRINWAADNSSRGRNESFGMMANYIYE